MTIRPLLPADNSIEICNFMLETVIYNNSEKVAIGSEKVTKDIFEILLDEKNYNGPTARNLINIYDEIETNQVFGASEVAVILDLSYSGARKVLGKLIDMDILIAVKG